MNRSNNLHHSNTTGHDVFPGMSLFYHNIYVRESSLDICRAANENLLEIIHCREGKMECKVGDHYYCISPGDMLIAQEFPLNDAMYFPLEHYRGVTIHIDVNQAPKCLSCFLEDVSVQPEMIKQKFSRFRPCFITRSNASVEHIFAELYTVPQEIRLPYFKIKILELMLFLSVIPLESEEPLSQEASPYQVKLAKKVCEYLTANMDERITLDEVSSYFDISSTKIKNAFKQVYGIPFYAFLKAHKMESAAYMLEHTDESVIEIAGKHGYENPSKFANAFKSAKGLSPLKYRAVCKKRHISDTVSNFREVI